MYVYKRKTETVYVSHSIKLLTSSIVLLQASGKLKQNPMVQNKIGKYCALASQCLSAVLSLTSSLCL